jgi:hypothetical protein
MTLVFGCVHILPVHGIYTACAECHIHLKAMHLLHVSLASLAGMNFI